MNRHVVHCFFLVAAALALASLDAHAESAGDTIISCLPKGSPCTSSSQCCSNRLCVGVCIDRPTCQGEGNVCTSTSQCCGSRVCHVGFCRTRAAEGESCVDRPCASGLTCDVLAGLKCVQPSGVGEQCATKSCASGLVCVEPQLLCAHDPGREHEPCSAFDPCGEGLTCDGVAGLTCQVPSGVGEQCATKACRSDLDCVEPLFLCAHQPGRLHEPCSAIDGCEDGLACTSLTTFRCVHSPAEEGEFCDATAPCGNGLFCQAGTQTCQRRGRAGDGCALLVNPCAAGLSCEACFTPKCNHPFQCFPDGTNGTLSRQQCLAVYSPSQHEIAMEDDTTMTFGVGGQFAGGVSIMSEIGAAYGRDGRYGCYSTLCAGVEADVEVSNSFSVGNFGPYSSLPGASFVTVIEGEIPPSLNFSVSLVKPSANAPLSGVAETFSVGVSAVPFPISAGAYGCYTVLDTVMGPPLPPPPPQAPADATCGDPTLDGNVTVSDARKILRASVGLEGCDRCTCDTNGDGAIQVTDALLAIRYVVGQPVMLSCIPCSIIPRVPADMAPAQWSDR